MTTSPSSWSKYLTVVSSFIVMLCIGGIYAWSITAAELIENYDFSATQTQIIFGLLFAVFPFTMIFTGWLGKRVKHIYLGYASGALFSLGYFIAGYSQGNFLLVFLGIGIIGGIATGLGYWVSLTSPVQLFPDRKGLITGIAAAGFGLGAVFTSAISEHFLNAGDTVLDLFKKIGLIYGLTIIVLANFIKQIQPSQNIQTEDTPTIAQFTKTPIFKQLFIGMFLGTFAGLLIIGSLRILGIKYGISEHYLILGVSFFAVSNFLGRLIWGLVSDYIGASLTIFLALLLQSASIISLNLFSLNDMGYLIVSSFVGFGFGGNFVLFAKESAHVFGVKNLGLVYPYVFLGYAIAGITGPFSGGALYDYSGSYFYAILLASIMSLIGSLLFLWVYLKGEEKL